MNTQARIINRMTCDYLGCAEDSDKLRELRGRIPGWSTMAHMLFFKAVLAEPSVKNVLVCGVYHGLDLAILQYLVDRHYAHREIRLTGVDLFSSEPCADWPEAKKGMSWQEAHNCLPPDLMSAQANCPRARILVRNSIEHLEEHAREYDFIFLDTSHDFDTVAGEIKRTLGTPAILAGDDYTGPEEWGVDRAVGLLLPQHIVVFNRIWIYAP